jgi:hypothetical protein
MKMIMVRLESREWFLLLPRNALAKWIWTVMHDRIPDEVKNNEATERKMMM